MNSWEDREINFRARWEKNFSIEIDADSISSLKINKAVHIWNYDFSVWDNFSIVASAIDTWEIVSNHSGRKKKKKEKNFFYNMKW